MKTTFGFILMLLLSTALWAQGDGGMDCPCEQTVSLLDATCTWPHDCLSTDGCTSTTFVASCTGNYKFNVSIFCEAGNCTDYRVCANVYENGNLVPGGNCHNTPCNSDCDYLCGVCLHYGHTYTLYVCLIRCTGGDCPSPTFCNARADLTYCGPGTVACN